MPDNKKKVGPPDTKKINVNQPHEVAYWTKTLGVTATQLRAAVKSVGVSVPAVKKKLGK